MRKSIGITAVALLAAGLLSGTSSALAAAPPALPAAHVWVTTPDGSLRMADLGATPFHQGASASLTVTVDPSRVYQRMDGFGASITDSSASVLYRLGPQQRDAAMRDLFSADKLDVSTPADGRLGFRRRPVLYLRRPAARRHGLRNASLLGRSTTASRSCRLLRQALALNPALKIVATPWSPPAWMKTPATLIGGRLIDDPRIYSAYAQYFVKFIQAYQRAGVPIYAVTLQNEPQNRHPNAYPGMDLPVAQEAKLVNALGPALQRAGLHTKLLGYDHNWSEHPNDIASTPPGEDPEVNYPFDLLATTAGHWLAGTAFHCYAGDQVRQTELHNAFPDKEIWFTECSGSHGPTDPPAQVFSDTLKWHARNLVLGVTRNWGQTVVNWNLALDPSRRPAQRRLRHVHRRAHGRPRADRDPRRRVLHARPSGPLRPAGRGAHRQHVVRHDRLERADHGRCIPQPGWVDRVGRPQRERQPGHLRRCPRRRIIRLHAARRRARYLRLAGVPSARQRIAAAARRSNDRHGDVRRRGRCQSRRRRRQHAVDDRRRAAAGADPAGRSRQRRRGPSARPRHRA